MFSLIEEAKHLHKSPIDILVDRQKYEYVLVSFPIPTLAIRIHIASALLC